jgi:hypothetical protein
LARNTLVIVAACGDGSEYGATADHPRAKGTVVKAVAFVFGLCISAVGVIGVLAPSGLV